MTNKILFENDRFAVAVETEESLSVNGFKYYAYYAVTNKDTAVKELKTPSLLDAIFFAENCDRMLATKPWEWARQDEILAAEAAKGAAN